MTFSIEAGRRCGSGPGTFIFETKQGDELLCLMDLAIQQQKNLGFTGGKRPSSGNLLDIHINTYSDSSFSPVYSSSVSPIRSAESEHIKLVTGTQKHAGESISMPEIVYSNPTNVVGLDECMHTQSSAHCNSKNIEPLYSDPVDAIQPTFNVQKYASANIAKSTETPYNVSASQLEPVYSEISNFGPYPAQKEGSIAQNEEEPIYSLPEVCVVYKTQEDIHTSTAKDSKQNTQSNMTEEVIYSQVNKPKKSTKPQEKCTNFRAQDVMSEDLGLI